MCAVALCRARAAPEERASGSPRRTGLGSQVGGRRGWGEAVVGAYDWLSVDADWSELAGEEVSLTQVDDHSVRG